jgi:putative sigma-54 modulation protein
MPIAVSVTFRNMDSSPSLEMFIRRWAERLERVDPRVQSCDVTIEIPHHRHQQGNHFRVQLMLAVPGKQIAISHEPGDDGAHEDVRVAVRDSFRAARRQLEDFVRRQRSHRAA